MPTEVQIYRDGTIVGADIANNTITATQIANKTITATQIADNTITAAQLAVGAVIPTGGIIMWSGTIANIPTGWALCNGANGTPNLQDRFIVGATSGGDGDYPGVGVNQTGGNKDAIIPYHNHIATSTARVDRDYTYGQRSAGTNSGGSNKVEGLFNQTPTVTVSTTVNYAGTVNNEINANLPPYYALAFIMKT
jgi:hypothetical protein